MRARVAAALLLLLPACQPRQDTARAAHERAMTDAELRAVSAAWDEIHDTGDAARLMEFYGDGAVSMPFNRPALEGKPAIEQDFRAFFQSFTAVHRTTVDAIEISGDLAIERGHYQLTVTPKGRGIPASETGKHLVVRRRVNGLWLIQWEIWNTDAPAPVP